MHCQEGQFDKKWYLLLFGLSPVINWKTVSGLIIRGITVGPKIASCETSSLRH